MKVRGILYLVLLSSGLTVVLCKLKCKDESRLCKYYPKTSCIEGKPHYKFMKENCKDSCGICNCKKWIYDCCRDEKTHADGFNQKGCPQKLCYDVKPNVCQEKKKKGKCERDKDMASECPWSCGTCHKSPAPVKSCVNIGYDCCWDGKTTALGHNDEGCPPCRDYYPHACRQFVVRPNCRETGSYFRRDFLENNCFETCGVCGQICKDKDNRCARFQAHGYCENRIWAPYLKILCRKSCGHC